MKRKISFISKSLTIFMLLLLIHSTQAATVTWLGGSSSWNEPSQWDSGSIPTAGDDVIIPSGRVEILNNRVVLAKSIEVQSAAQLFVHNGGALNIADAVGKDGIHNVGEITIAGELSVSNTTGLVLQGPGRGIFNEAYFSISGTGNIRLQSTDFFAIENVSPGQIDNQGTIDITDIDGHGIKSMNQFRNSGAINITANNSNTNVGIVNFGDFDNVAGGAIFIDGGGSASFANHDSGTGGALQNYGTIEVNNSNSAGFNNTGLINNHSNGLLMSRATSSHGFYNQANGTITNHGNMESHNDSNGIFNIGQIYNHASISLFHSTSIACQGYAGSLFENHGVFYANSNGVHDLFVDGAFTNHNNGFVTINNEIFVAVNGRITNNGILSSNYNGIHSKDASGVLVNYGAVGDRYSGFQHSMDNQQVIVESLTNSMQEGVPYPNALDVVALNNVTALGWYTDQVSLIDAGTYNPQSNTFTPNANAVGLNTLYVRVEINGSGIRKYFTIVVSGGIFP